MRRIFIAGNWKMNKTPDEASTFSTALKTKLADYTRTLTSSNGTGFRQYCFPLYLTRPLILDLAIIKDSKNTCLFVGIPWKWQSLGPPSVFVATLILHHHLYSNVYNIV